MNSEHEKISDILKTLLLGLTNFHSQLSMEAREVGDVGLSLKISTQHSDCGKVVGSQGKNIKALKAIFRAISHTGGAIYNIILEEPHDYQLLEGKEVNECWQIPKYRNLIESICERLTRFPVTVDSSESTECLTLMVVFSQPATVPEEVKSGLDTIFKGIGKNHGIRIEVVTN